LPISGGRFAAGERERRGKREKGKGVFWEGKEGERERGRRRERVQREGRGSLRHWR